VSALLIAALGLGSWQLADALMDQGNKSEDTKQTQTTDGNDKSGDKTKPVKTFAIQGAKEFVAKGDAQHPNDVDKTYDGDKSTYWRTSSFIGGPVLAPYKPGVGIVYDLGSVQDVSTATIGLYYGGDHTTVKLYATNSLSSSSLDSMTQLGTVTTTGTSATVKVTKHVRSRYVLVWLTALPHADSDQYSDAGYKQAITDVKFTG
jgi:hypothetical protein